MKVLTLNGSPRRNGNTQLMVQHLGKALERANIDVEHLNLRDFEVRPCIACEACYAKSWGRPSKAGTAWKCSIKDDAVKILGMMRESDGIVLASPVYGADVTAQLKALMDRSVIVYQHQEFKDKVGGAVIVGAGRHGGQELALMQILSFFAFQGMIVASPKGGLFGAMGTADARGDIAKDKDALDSATDLGKRMAELMRLVRR